MSAEDPMPNVPAILWDPWRDALIQLRNQLPPPSAPTSREEGLPEGVEGGDMHPENESGGEG